MCCPHMSSTCRPCATEVRLTCPQPICPCFTKFTRLLHSLAQIRPRREFDVTQIRPELAQIRPELKHIWPDVDHLLPMLVKLDPTCWQKPWPQCHETWPKMLDRNMPSLAYVWHLWANIGQFGPNLQHRIEVFTHFVPGSPDIGQHWAKVGQKRSGQTRGIRRWAHRGRE